MRCRIGAACIVLGALVAACAAPLGVPPAREAPAPAAVAPPAAEPQLPGAALSPPEIATELARLRAAFAAEVPAPLPADRARDAARLALAQAAMATAGEPLAAPQLVLLVDRNPAVQTASILLAQPGAAPWAVIGSTRVSTGQAGRRGYYLTPLGAFRHTDAIRDYRAEGTLNAQGIRGLGARGMRVWDFGWQEAEKGWRRDAERGPIRLLVHATDPDRLEQRLGSPASQGCVRVPASMNLFLDRHGVLDADHERAAAIDPAFAALLRRDRSPSPLAGRLLLVVDSGAARPQARMPTEDVPVSR